MRLNGKCFVFLTMQPFPHMLSGNRI